MKRNRILAILMAMSMLLLAACGGGKTGDAPDAADPQSEAGASAEGSGEYTIAYITQTVTNQYWDTVVKGFEAQCKELGVKYITYDSNADAGTQLTQIEDCISMGVDAILLSPIDDESASAMIDMVKEAGIPIFIVDIGAKDEVDCVIISDNYGAGKMLGEYAYEKRGDDLKTVVISTPPGVLLTEQRRTGYTDFFDEKKLPYDMLTLKLNYDRADVLKMAEDSITTFKDMNTVFAPNDDAAMGVIEALKAAGLTDVDVYGFDATDEGLAAIEAGTLTATIAQQPYLFGVEAVNEALKCIKGEDFKKNVDMPCLVINKDNLEEYRASLK